MSLFLGKIHYWLYHKILIHEKLIQSVVGLANGKGYDCGDLLAESHDKYGEPVTGELEDCINLSNIHGWLQERIFSVEKRLAFVITELLKNDAVKTEEIALIFNQNGVEAMNALDIKEGKPQDLYTLIFDHMLDGMPCDNVNQILESTDDFISWKTTRCLHKDHWDEVAGDVGNFYNFRDSWIGGFVNTSGTGYNYLRSPDGINTIRRV
ncbi:MAG TPA: hypothetical protein VM577_17910 [Anaerovoracaceae bacterium]|nr:hypothetical protein [Anaerovoracaceae bacterium]